jgi:hypothetical protein
LHTVCVIVAISAILGYVWLDLACMHATMVGLHTPTTGAAALPAPCRDSWASLLELASFCAAYSRPTASHAFKGPLSQSMAAYVISRYYLIV